MSAMSLSNAEQEEEEEQASPHQIAPVLIDFSTPPVSANNADHDRTRAINRNSSYTSAAHSDSDQHYCKKLRSHAHPSSTPAISNISDAPTTSSTPHEVMSRSDMAGASRQRSTLVSSEQARHCMATTELDNPSPKQNFYTCHSCRKHFRSGQSLGGHMNSHRNANANPRQEVDQEAGPSSQPSVENATTYRGVRHRKEQNKWVVEIRPPKDPKTVWVGTYDSQMEAAYAYDAAICYFGTGSPLNFGMHELYRNIQKVPAGSSNKQRLISIRKVIKAVSRQAMDEDRIRSQPAQALNARGDRQAGLLDHHVDPSIASTSGSTPPPYSPGIAAPTDANVREEQCHEANVSEDNMDLMFLLSLQELDDSDILTDDQHPNP